MFTVSSLWPLTILKIWTQVARLGFKEFSVEIVFLRPPWTKALRMSYLSGKLCSRDRARTLLFPPWTVLPLIRSALAAICQVIYQTWDAVFHHQMKHREESWKYDALRSIFDELHSVSSGDETLCRMFDISSQTKSFLKEKLRMQILSSVSSDFQTLIKH